MPDIVYNIETLNGVAFYQRDFKHCKSEVRGDHLKAIINCDYSFSRAQFTSGLFICLGVVSGDFSCEPDVFKSPCFVRFWIAIFNAYVFQCFGSDFQHHPIPYPLADIFTEKEIMHLRLLKYLSLPFWLNKTKISLFLNILTVLSSRSKLTFFFCCLLMSNFHQRESTYRAIAYFSEVLHSLESQPLWSMLTTQSQKYLQLYKVFKNRFSYILSRFKLFL